MRVSLFWAFVLALSGASADAASAQSADFGAKLEAIRHTRNVPAIGGLLLRGGEVVVEGVAGTTEAGGEAAVAAGDAWHLGSDTKAMTATLAARLIEAGKITWDTTLADGLPDLAGDMHDSQKSVTLRQLLGHRGGVGGDGSAASALQARLWEIERTMADAPIAERRRTAARAILADAPVGRPGETYAYSNFGYILAGAMLERAGGDSWESLMRREVFNPLKMTTAGFGPPPRIRGHLKGVDDWAPQTRDNPPTLGPAGTVHCSLQDWSKFAAAHLGHGPAGYLSADSLKMLHEPLPGGGGTRYAMGWIVIERDGRTLLAHEGSNTMWYAAIVLDPARDEARLAVCNAPDQSACYDVLRALATSAPASRPAGQSASAPSSGGSGGPSR